MGDVCNRSHQTPNAIRGGIEVDPNRYACTVLEEARAALAKLNWVTMAFSKRHLATLLEELQTIVNRMEAGLEDKSDYSSTRDRLREARGELTDLKAEKAELQDEIKALKAVFNHLIGKIENPKGKIDAAAYGRTEDGSCIL